MNNRWAGKLAGRVLCNALAGGVLVAIVGAFCLGIAGASAFAVLDFLVYGKVMGGMQHGFRLSSFGSAIGFVLGLLIFGIAAVKTPPGRLFAPLQRFVGRVALGQLLGTLGALSFFAVLVVAKAQLQNQSLAKTVSADLIFIAFGVPITMICGAIAGALSKREKRQSATLKAE